MVCSYCIEVFKCKTFALELNKTKRESKISLWKRKINNIFLVPFYYRKHSWKGWYSLKGVFYKKVNILVLISDWISWIVHQNFLSYNSCGHSSGGEDITKAANLTHSITKGYLSWLIITKSCNC